MKILSFQRIMIHNWIIPMKILFFRRDTTFENEIIGKGKKTAWEEIRRQKRKKDNPRRYFIIIPRFQEKDFVILLWFNIKKFISGTNVNTNSIEIQLLMRWSSFFLKK
ncbi:MAG: hypothetical protein ACXAC6_12025 [Candidatus Hodarchaeales archaeon]